MGMHMLVTDTVFANLCLAAELKFASRRTVCCVGIAHKALPSHMLHSNRAVKFASALTLQMVHAVHATENTLAPHATSICSLDFACNEHSVY